jgi:xanthine dehydrogenase small subunit
MVQDYIWMLRGTRLVGFSGLPPTMTVLQFLRGPEGGYSMGTKEGCAEGDCGACTVVLGELDGDRIRYRAVNSCIQFLPTLDGKQLITVEDLKAPDGRLHPVQQAMVETHGSQCGFCTPGFVMSLFALFHESSSLDRAGIEDALAGNLCRCTRSRRPCSLSKPGQTIAATSRRQPPTNWFDWWRSIPMRAFWPAAPMSGCG